MAYPLPSFGSLAMLLANASSFPKEAGSGEA